MSSREGVAYQEDDYAGLVRRILAGGIDFVAILILLPILSLPLQLFLKQMPGLWLVWGFGMVWLYLVVLKRSPVRTLGYRIAGVKVVDLQGGRPGIWCLTVRALFAFFGPFAPVLDFFWISDNPQKRALRDLLGQTYVVRIDAQPVGRVSLRYRVYDIWGYNAVLLEPM
jgi:uncharacterized RDD family membrane protein YckC